MGPYSFIYRAKTSKRSKNRHLEPWPSARVVVPSRWIEHLSSGYKSEVIAIILRRHMARSTGREPDGLTTTLRLAGEPNTSLVYSAYLAHDRAFEAHRLSPTHRFQVGSCTLQVYRAFKTSTFIFIKLTFCPLSTWKSIGTEPLGNQVPMAEIIWLLIAHQTDIAFSDIKTVCHSRQI